MKGILLLAAQLLIAIPGWSQSLADSVFKKETLQKDINFLASDSLKGRLFETAGADKAAIYISNRFLEAGLKPLDINDGFSMQVNKSVGNIVGAIPGKSRSGEFIIFSAHYDHVGTIQDELGYLQKHTTAEKKGDSIFNGANDNASGIALLLQLAEYLVKENSNERTVIFNAFTGEEEGFIGSKNFAALITKPKSIKAMINFDMVGRPDNNMAGAYITGNYPHAIISLLNNTLKSNDKKYAKNFFSSDPFPFEQLNKRSDHVPFAELGIYAVTILATSPYDKYYHTVNDEPNTLNYSYLLMLTKAVAIAVKPLLADATLN